MFLTFNSLIRKQINKIEKKGILHAGFNRIRGTTSM